MNKRGKRFNLGVIAGASALILGLPNAHAGDNPFAISATEQAMIQLADARGDKGISVLEGKCGAGKCGTQRVREMMDKNADGKIDRNEYLSWSAALANREYDEMSGGKASIDVDDVFKHYQSLEFHRQG